MEPFKKKNRILRTGDEPAGQDFLSFVRELGVALIMALIVIFYVIQAFKIPSGSMENSLYPNDFLLGLKFIYGAPVVPFTYLKFPGLTSPKPNDVVIFKFPGPARKDYIKRCIAGPGQTLEVRNKTLIVDGKPVPMPPQGKHTALDTISNGDPRDNFRSVRVPCQGDTLRPAELDVRGLLFARGIVQQENPRERDSILVDLQLYIDGVYSNDRDFPFFLQRNPFPISLHLSFSDINTDLNTKEQLIVTRQYLSEVKLEWHDIEAFIETLKRDTTLGTIEVKGFLKQHGQPIEEYVLKHDCYFMMGDNRDNSKDSRYWGFLNRNYVKAKAFILYFSYNSNATIFQTLLNPFRNVRWSRIGKLIK